MAITLTEMEITTVKEKNNSSRSWMRKHPTLFRFMSKFKILILSVIVISCFAFAGIFLKYRCSLVSFGKLKFHNEDQMIVIDDSSLIFDSGCSRSIIYRKNKCKIIVGLRMCFDSNKHLYFMPIYYISNMRLGENISVENLFCAFDNIKSRNSGIIGMDIIRSANWHILLRNNNMEILPLNHCLSIPDNAICMKYKKEFRPQCTLYINGVLVENVLIDIGFNGDIDLSKHDFDKISKTGKCKSQEKVTSVASRSRREYVSYIYDDVSVQNINCKDIRITMCKKNVVGLGFLSRFDHLFWDSRHRKVYLWNEEEK